MSQRVGGQRPTNSARRSAFPRSSWSTVFARIHSAMHSAIEPKDSACICQPLRPASWRRLVSIARDYPSRSVS